MNLAEKILARASGRKEVSPGEFIWAQVDVALANDVTGPGAAQEMKRIGAKKVFDPEKVVLVPDHFVPNSSMAAAAQAKVLREFAREQEIPNYFEVGRMGIEHALLPEQGLVGPGQLIIGADSHTCTYGALGAFSTGVGTTDLAAAWVSGQIWLQVPRTFKFSIEGKLNPWVSGKDLILFIIGQIGTDGALYGAMEFCGQAIRDLPMAGRFTMANMAVEAGAKAGIFQADDKTKEYVKGRFRGKPEFFASDPDAKSYKTFEWDASEIQPQVAFPSSPANVRNVRDAADITIDQVVIGSCTNGRLQDLEQAAGILKGKKVNPNVRLIVIPATQNIYMEALRKGYVETFIEAGAVVSTPTCGPCMGAHTGVLAEGERAVSTTNRNFVGRMGHPKSEVYLVSPAVAAASAVKGRISHPEEVVS